jgi:hypothetical protein
MTPKEKAQEIIEKYIYIQSELEETTQFYLSYAVKCALIAVNEILDLGYVPNEKSTFNVYKFYSEVKLEIELL